MFTPLSQIEVVESFKALGTMFGIPGAMAIFGLFAIHRGWFVAGKTHRLACEEKKAITQELRAEREELKAERERYIKLLNRQHMASERAVMTMEKLVDFATAPPRRS